MCAEPDEPRKCDGGEIWPESQSWPCTQDDDVLALIYDELKRVAAWHLASIHGELTLGVTDLAHEAIGRLLRQDRSDLENRDHLLAIASLMVRRVLRNHLRDRSAIKRGGSKRPVRLLADPATASEWRPEDMLALCDAIDRLESVDQRQSFIAQMKLFGDLSSEKISKLLSISVRTVQLEWTHARHWLARELSE